MFIWIVLVSLIVIGLALVIIEVIFVPGTTIVGLFGLVCLAAGIWISFAQFGTGVGWIVTAISAVSAGGLTIYSFRAGAWKKFALDKTINSKVNEDKPLPVDIGSQGLSLIHI